MTKTHKTKHIHDVPPFDLRTPSRCNNPFVFASPHSGRYYSKRFTELSNLSELTLRGSEDAYVDELFGSVTSFGSPFLVANYPRSYVDLNREPMELDPKMFSDLLPSSSNTKSDRVAVGLGTIPRVVSFDQDIYAKKLKYFEEKSRLDDIYTPYHKQLQALLLNAKAKYGWATLIDCHSMPSLKLQPDTSISKKLFGAPPSHGFDCDIILGDRYSGSCSIHLTNILERLFRDLGYSVARNDPYAGGYCTSFYGRPKIGIHAIQIEVNRKLYLNESTVTKRASATKKLSNDISSIMAELTGLDLSNVRPLAAE
ncbi:MAG: N-formylglutamate amidohydrolase [Sphingomonadales bacterium]|nr:N-formylglutamate amidohydrolase [Sphingomonadales bacterium]